jgi:hypothetical protein
MMFLVLDKDTAISTLIFVKGTLTFFFKFQAYNVAGPLYMKFQHYSLKNNPIFDIDFETLILTFKNNNIKHSITIT